MIVDAATVKVTHQPKQYSEFVSDLKALTPGKATMLSIPKGATYRAVYQRSAMLITYHHIKAPAGYMFSRLPSKDGKSIVFSLKAKRAVGKRKGVGSVQPAKAMKPLKQIKKQVLKARAKIIKHKAARTRTSTSKAPAASLTSKQLKKARDARYRAKCRAFNDAAKLQLSAIKNKAD